MKVPSEHEIQAEMKETGFDRYPCIRRIQQRQAINRSRDRRYA